MPPTSLALLGSGGWIPTAKRATCSALVRRDDCALIIDAGTGIGRLLDEPRLLDGVRHLDIVLTHFHLDHVVGLAYLPALPIADRPRLFAPGEWLYGTASEDILTRLLGPPLFGLELGEIVSEVHELHEGGVFAGPFHLASRVQAHHSDPTLALRLDELFTYCTDTAYDRGNVDFASESAVLLHEAWYTEDAAREEAIHSSAREAAEVAAQAEVGRLVLIHIRPDIEEGRLVEEAQARFPRVSVGIDLESVSLVDMTDQG